MSISKSTFGFVLLDGFVGGAEVGALCVAGTASTGRAGSVTSPIALLLRSIIGDPVHDLAVADFAVVRACCPPYQPVSPHSGWLRLVVFSAVVYGAGPMAAAQEAPPWFGTLEMEGQFTKLEEIPHIIQAALRSAVGKDALADLRGVFGGWGPPLDDFGPAAGGKQLSDVRWWCSYRRDGAALQ